MSRQLVRWRFLGGIAMALAATAAACGEGSSTPNEPDPPPRGRGDGLVSQTVADPIGDVFATGGKQWDLTAFTVSRDTAGVTVKLDFTEDVISPMSGDTLAIIGFVEFDLDQNAVTGGGSVVDEFRLVEDRGTTGIGVERTIDIVNYAADSTVTISDSLANPVGHIKPVFLGRSITLRIPAAMLGNDDGFLNAASIIGRLHRPTDFVPQDGHLTLGGAP